MVAAPASIPKRLTPLVALVALLGGVVVWSVSGCVDVPDPTPPATVDGAEDTVVDPKPTIDPFDPDPVDDPLGRASWFDLPVALAGTRTDTVVVDVHEAGATVRTAFDNCTGAPHLCWSLIGIANGSEAPSGGLLLDLAAGTLTGHVEERWSGRSTGADHDFVLRIDLALTLDPPTDDGPLGSPRRALRGTASVSLDATLTGTDPRGLCGNDVCRSVRRLADDVEVEGQLSGELVSLTVERRPPIAAGEEGWAMRTWTVWRLPFEPLR